MLKCVLRLYCAYCSNSSGGVCRVGRETAGVVRRAARYAAQRGAARPPRPRSSSTSVAPCVRAACHPFSLRRFSLRSIKLIVRVDTNCACHPTRCSAKARTPGRQANPIARLFRASPLPDVFSFFFSPPTDRLNFTLILTAQ